MQKNSFLNLIGLFKFLPNRTKNSLAESLLGIPSHMVFELVLLMIIELQPFDLSHVLILGLKLVELLLSETMGLSS